MSSTTARIAKNTGYLYAKMGITMFISLYTTRLILNGLGASDFGIYNIVGGAIAMLGFLNNAMSGATQRFMSYAEGMGDRNRLTGIFNVSIIIHAFIALIMLVVLAVAGFIFFNGTLNIPLGREYAAVIVYACLVVSTLFSVFAVPYEAVLNAHENMRFYAFTGILESLLKLSIAFVCVYAETDRLVVYGILMAVIPLVILLVQATYCHKKYQECILAPATYYDRNTFKEMLSFAGWNLMGVSSGMIGNYGLGIVLNHFFGTLLNAAYGIANQLNGMLLAFANNMLKAFNPVITKNEGAGNREAMIYHSTMACKLSFFLTALFAVPAILEMPFVLQLWLKNVPEWAVIFCTMLLVRTLVEQLAIAYWTAINSEGDISQFNKWFSVLNVCPIVITGILFALGFQPDSMLWVNIMFFGIFTDILKVFYMNRNCGMPVSMFMKGVLFPAAITSVFSVVSGYIPHLFLSAGFLRLCLTIALSVISLSISSFIFGLDKSEKYLFVSFIKEKFDRHA